MPHSPNHGGRLTLTERTQLYGNLIYINLIVNSSMIIYLTDAEFYFIPADHGSKDMMEQVLGVSCVYYEDFYRKKAEAKKKGHELKVI